MFKIDENTCWKSRQNPTDGAKKPQGRLCHLQFAERPKIELIKIEERLYL